MKKIIVILTIFLLGVFVGLLTSVGYLYYRNRKTEIWVSNSDIRSSDGLQIPADTEFIHERWMPEGFATIKLYLNIEGAGLDAFESKIESKYNLVIPYKGELTFDQSVHQIE